MAVSLAAQILKVPGAPSSVRIGTVTSLSPVTISVQGAEFSGDAVGVLGELAGVGDPVALLGQSKTQGADPSSWLVLGPVFPSSLGGAPQAKAWHSTLISLPDNTATLVPLQSLNWDNDGQWAPGDGLVCSRAGRYLVLGSIGIVLGAASRRMCQLRINGVVRAEQSVPAVTVFSTIVQAHAELDLNVGDVVNLYGLQSSGGPLNTVPNEQDSWLSIRRVGASVGI